MTGTITPVRRIKAPTPPERRYAERLIKAHHALTSSLPAEPKSTRIRVVCISDTHNRRPEVPDGDVLIHAGDLTVNGSFAEVQQELDWLASLPHKHKIFVAGNHDVLLDEAFLHKHPERRYGQKETRDDLRWGDVVYLQDETITLTFPELAPDGGAHDKQHPPRALTIFGSPWTPQYGISGFQYPPIKEEHWKTRFAALQQQPDIVVTHGPPQYHLDKTGFRHAGCPHLGREIRRIRPQLCIFGHIHVGYGREDVLFDRAQRAYEDVITGWSRWGGVLRLATAVAWARVASLFRKQRSDEYTVMVNAAVVGGPNNELRNDPVVVDL